ncbi:MAG: HD domain-containing protein [Candidatus Pacebacteria bacterium]|nr:HD domain-containing protein [Candidatus Paceibacterota bacterium]
MNTTALAEAASNLVEIRGALAHLQTSEEAAYRRREDDEDFLYASNPFVDDMNRILSSKAFRRLSKKTQVVSFPTNPHIRDRMSHTTEVVACATVISDILGLNIHLTQAIAFGHDTGHVPMGHAGEAFLAERSGRPFSHEVMGVVVAQKIERHMRGLNLTHQVLDGMFRHSGKNFSPTMSPEAMVVRIADKVAYLFADYNDFARMGHPLGDELKSLVESFGANQRNRVAETVSAICCESAQKGRVEFADCDAAKRFDRLRSLMYEVYPRITAQDPRRILEPIYDFLEKMNVADPLLLISLMTDQDVGYLAGQFLINTYHIKQTGAGEALDYIKGLTVDYCDPDLDWCSIEAAHRASPHSGWRFLFTNHLAGAFSEMRIIVLD